MGFVEFRFDPRRAAAILTERKLALYEDCMSDFWIDLLGGLVERFMSRRNERNLEEAFLAYSSGVVRHLLIKNAQSLGLIPRESVAEALRALCSAKRETTRNAHIARVKFRLWHQVKRELLLIRPSEGFAALYRDIHHVVDFFFESYIPRSCHQIDEAPNREIVTWLIGRFSEQDLREGLEFIGKITPVRAEPRMTELSPDQQSAFLRLLTA